MPEQFAQLETEARNPRTFDLDRLSTRDLVSRLHAESFSVPEAVSSALPQIATLVEQTAERLKGGGRLFYVGAGTSGRLGVLDASECPPTFGVPAEMVQGIIAGGTAALTSSIEGAEDHQDQGAADISERAVCDRDVVVGIAASGRTPYVIGALRAARSAGAITAAVVNVRGSALSAHADITIEAVTGPEPLTGSTRLKAGTAQKLVLNLITTATMVCLGKAYSNLMVDVRASNEKLRDRAVRIVMSATGANAGSAAGALELCDWRAKVAIVMIKASADADAAERLLSAAGGQVRLAIEQGG